VDLKNKTNSGVERRATRQHTTALLYTLSTADTAGSQRLPQHESRARVYARVVFRPVEAGRPFAGTPWPLARAARPADVVPRPAARGA